MKKLIINIHQLSIDVNNSRMGVRYLQGLLFNKYPKLIKTTTYSNYIGQICAIDAIQVIHEYAYIAIQNGKKQKDKNGYTTYHIFAVFYLALQMLKHKIYPLFIFDGFPPGIKYEMLKKKSDKRWELKKKLNLNLSQDERKKIIQKVYKVSQYCINDSKQILDYLGLTYIQADHEADNICASLLKNQQVDYILSGDTDMLLLGCDKIVKRSNNVFIEIHLSDILETFDLTQDQFLELCILLGTDYLQNTTIDKRSVEEVVKIYRHYKSLDSMIAYNKSFLTEEFIKQWRTIFNYYKNLQVNINIDIHIKWNTPDYEKLIKFLVDKNLNTEILATKITILKELRLRSKFV